MTEGTATSKTKAEAPPKRFFAYCKVERPPSVEKQRELCRTFVAAQGGAIVDEAFDVGAGAVVDMPGYARLYDALEGGTVDAFVTDMTVFGPTVRGVHRRRRRDMGPHPRTRHRRPYPCARRVAQAWARVERDRAEHAGSEKVGELTKGKEMTKRTIVDTFLPSFSGMSTRLEGTVPSIDAN